MRTIKKLINTEKKVYILLKNKAIQYEGIVSPAYTVLSPNSGINSKCLAYQFKLPEMIHTFQVNSQGITSDNWNLKYPVLSKIEIFVSKDEQEQAKIAEYFENLDNLITLHQRECIYLFS